jgi:hypothetical protein
VLPLPLPSAALSLSMPLELVEEGFGHDYAPRIVHLSHEARHGVHVNLTQCGRTSSNGQVIKLTFPRRAPQPFSFRRLRIRRC